MFHDSKMMADSSWDTKEPRKLDRKWRALEPQSVKEPLTSLSSAPLHKSYEADSLFERYQFSKVLCTNVDERQLKKAFLEAVALLNSGMFSRYLRPHIGVDEYGEFSLSIKNDSGYFDIGVNGTGEISYHVRNDAFPQLSVYGDKSWDGHSLPGELIEGALKLLRT